MAKTGTGAEKVEKEEIEKCLFDSIDFTIKDDKTTKQTKLAVFNKNDASKKLESMYLLTDFKNGTAIQLDIKKINEDKCRKPDEHKLVIIKNKKSKEETEIDYKANSEINIKYLNIDEQKTIFEEGFEELLKSPPFFIINNILPKSFITGQIVKAIQDFLAGFKYAKFIFLPKFASNDLLFYQEDEIKFNSCKERDKIKTKIISYPNLEFDAFIKIDFGKIIQKYINEYNKTVAENIEKNLPEQVKEDVKTQKEFDKTIKELEKSDRQKEIDKANKDIENAVNDFSKITQDKQDTLLKEYDTHKEEKEKKKNVVLDSSNFKFIVNYEGEEHNLLLDTSIFKKIEKFFDMISYMYAITIGLLKKIELIDGEVESLNLVIGDRWKYAVSEDFKQIGNEHNIHLGFQPLIKGSVTFHLLELIISAFPGGVLIAQASLFIKSLIEKLGLKDYLDWYFDAVVEGEVNIEGQYKISSFKHYDDAFKTKNTLELELKAGLAIKSGIGYIVTVQDLKAQAKTSLTIAGGKKEDKDIVAFCCSFDGLKVTLIVKGEVGFWIFKKPYTGKIEDYPAIAPRCWFKYVNNHAVIQEDKWTWFKTPTESEGCIIRQLGLRDCDCIIKPDKEKPKWEMKIGKEEEIGVGGGRGGGGGRGR